MDNRRIAAAKARRRAEAYAGKFHADTTRRGVHVEPTDAALAAIFAACVRPARRDEYPMIREAINTWTTTP